MRICLVQDIRLTPNECVTAQVQMDGDVARQMQPLLAEGDKTRDELMQEMLKMIRQSTVMTWEMTVSEDKGTALEIVPLGNPRKAQDGQVRDERRSWGLGDVT